MSLFGPTLRCQVCGTTKEPVDALIYFDRLRYFACHPCWNKTTEERNELPETKELFLLNDHIDHYRSGGSLVAVHEVTELSKRQFELTMFLVGWTQKKMKHDPYVRMEDREVLEHMKAGKH